MIEYKSQFKTVYVNPRGTSECTVCGDKLPGLEDIEMRNLWREPIGWLAITLRLP
ncbi:MAG: hypothetical protein QW839_01025 [Conexivisphaerales archaeon]